MIACAALLFAACHAAPPTYRVVLDADTVRADSPFLATTVAQMLGKNRGKVSELLPSSHSTPLEIWLQDELQLYVFHEGSYEDADGFWAADVGRIHLRTDARHLERTLVHELVHASMDDTWALLPGTLEEGLCDWVSTRACPEAAAQLRAGRLSAACFGLGGLEIEVELCSTLSEATAYPIAAHASILLDGGIEPPVRPEEVFLLEAGRSNSGIAGSRKKALYGLAFFLIDKIATGEAGLEGLHELCSRARAEGLEEVPSEWIIKAAGLAGLDASEWKEHLGDSFAGPELAELVAMYPDFLGSAIDQLSIPTQGAVETGELRFAMRVNPR